MAELFHEEILEVGGSCEACDDRSANIVLEGFEKFKVSYRG